MFRIFSTSLSWSDRILSKTILPLVPNFVYPNHITTLRFILTPLVAWSIWHEVSWGSLLFFLVTAFTDALDGALARVRQQITPWGKLYDPLADKILICSVVYVLVLKYVDSWAAGVIIALEFIIIILAVIKHYRDRQETQANLWGKIKMFLQVAGVTVLLLSIILNLPALFLFSQGTFYLAIAFGIISLFTYSI